MVLFLCSYGTDAQKNTLERLRHDALLKGKVDHVVFYGDQHPLIQTLRTKFPKQTELGLWRPYVLHYTLHNVDEGDTVVYVDPSWTIASDIAPHLARALTAAPGRDALLFPSLDGANHDTRQRVYCTQDCFEAMECTGQAYLDAPQVTAQIQVYRKSAAVMAFLEAYADAAQKLEALDDAHRKPNDPGFKEHRRDQSILTNLSVKHAATVTIASPQGPPPFVVPVALQNEQAAKEMPKTLVVTPTIGTKHLRRCIEGVQAQTMPGVEHLIVVDGVQHAQRVQQIVEPFLLKKPIHTLVLPFNTGAGGWNGHRIYASIPFLVDYEYLAFLDEDNWYDPEHVELLHRALASNRDAKWAFSLRKIVDKDGNFVANDNCESLGPLCHTVLAWEDFLVDTSCYLLPLSVARTVAPHWMHRAKQPGEVEADRAVVAALLGHRPVLPGACSATLTLNYRAAHGQGQTDFFQRGNAVMRYDFSTRPNLYVFHFNADKTAQFLLSMYKDDRSYALDEWQMTLLRGLRSRFNLINGFAVGPRIPKGSVAVFTICNPHELPADVLKRNDIRKIVYTIESPNIRHQHQWRRDFLFGHFDHVLTYWTPLLGDGRTTFCAHNTHHLDFDNPLDRALLHTPSKAAGKDVVMVLECRDRSGGYEIDGVPLQCLDSLRLAYVQNLKNITVYGMGWGEYRKNPKLKVGHTKHRSLDDRSTVDIIKEYTFVLIIENTDADGYVSEKIYDAFIAGCIPIYYGNNNANVGIPDGMFVDLRQYPSSEALQKYLDKLTTKQIEAKRKYILQHRDQVLQKVSTQAFADTVDRVYHQRN
jgi:glycosyltransferase involved in cell wall biosynthesis